MSGYVSFDKAIEQVRRAENIAIICHVNPDGDTLGSALALYNSLKMYGKTPYIFCSDMPSDTLSDNLPLVKELNSKSRDKYDLCIAVDTADMERLGSMADVFERSKDSLCIDHHGTNTRFAKNNIVVKDAAATAEIMYEFIAALGENSAYMDDISAKLLYTGLVTDSGTFSYSNVSEHTLYVAMKLKAYNFDASDLIYNIVRKKTKKVFNLTRRVLAGTKFYNDDKIALIVFRNEDFEATGTTTRDTEGIIVNLINIDSVLVAIAVSEVKKNSYKISLRTKAPVNAANIAVFFGGGGHERAAGCRIDGFYEDVEEKIVRMSQLEIGE